MEIQPSFEEELQKIEDKINDAKENLGDTEVRDAIMEKADLLLKQGKTEQAIETYEEAQQKSVGIGKKMDVLFLILAIYIQKRNIEKIKSYLDRQQHLLDQGGDWERKNKLKVYQGIYSLIVRDIKNASQLFIDCVATFTSSEIITYQELVKYAILTSIVVLDRVDLKKKVIHSPEVVGQLKESLVLKQFLESFVKCDYKNLFRSFVQITQDLQEDPYLQNHRKYLIREFRVVFYSQFLESYKTVTLQNMSEAFGVSENFLDRELSELIASRRLNCKIDKVSGIVESQRHDERNNLYQKVLKEGDFLLNRIQKFSRIAD